SPLYERARRGCVSCEPILNCGLRYSYFQVVTRDVPGQGLVNSLVTRRVNLNTRHLTTLHDSKTSQYSGFSVRNGSDPFGIRIDPERIKNATGSFATVRACNNGGVSGHQAWWRSASWPGDCWGVSTSPRNASGLTQPKRARAVLQPCSLSEIWCPTMLSIPPGRCPS